MSNPTVEIMLDPAVAVAGGVLATDGVRTVIVLDPALAEPERQALIRELLAG